VDWLNSEKEGLDIASTPQALVYWPVKVARFVGWATNGGLLSGDLTLLDIVQIVPRCEEAAQKEELESIIGETRRSLFSLLLLAFSPSLLLSFSPSLCPALKANTAAAVPCSPSRLLHTPAGGREGVGAGQVGREGEEAGAHPSAGAGERPRAYEGLYF
jgi:hypothetical protein